MPRASAQKMSTGDNNSRSASAPVSGAPRDRQHSPDDRQSGSEESGYDSDDIPYFEDFGSGHSIVPMRRIRSSQEMLIQQSSGSDMDAITGWLYNGPLQRAKYQDFSTIDWIYDNTKARHYKSDLRARARRKGRLGKLEMLADTSKPWLILLA
ncbi:hypothetical protein GGI16_003548, partial [Coemansia sp. S142-1]